MRKSAPSAPARGRPGSALLVAALLVLASCSGAGSTDEALPPAIAAEPADAQAREGATLTFSAAVTGSPAPALQWERQAPGSSAWGPVPGATGSDYTTPALAPADHGTRFRLQARNGAGAATSREAVASVTWLHLVASPADRAVTEGQGASFSAAFEGNPAPALQWEVLPPGGAWAAVPGATGPSLAWSAAAVADGGSRVRLAAANAFGEVRSPEAQLTVHPRPAVLSFTAPPRITAGDVTSLSFTFTGGSGSVSPDVGPVASGAPAPVAPSVTTTYTLTVTNPLGEVATATARVEVFPAPAITSFAAADAWVPAGGTTLLTAVFDAGPEGGASVSGVGPVLSGAAVPSPAIAAPTTFVLTVTNGAGRSATASATVDLLVAPAIAAEPADQVAREGASLTFSASVTGNPPPALQWERLAPGSAAWAPVPGAVASAFSTGPLAPADHGTRFRLTASNAGGAATSREAVATVTWLHLLSSPADREVTAGRDAAFAAAFDGSPAPALQWERQAPGSSTWSPIPGATGASYTWAAPGLADGGSRVRLAARNAFGDVPSQAALLTVIAAPSIGSFAAATPRLTAGEGTTLTYAFSGGTGAVDAGVGPVVSGGATTVYPAATTAYTLTVTNSLGEAVTAAAQVEVFPAPTIASFAAADAWVLPGATTLLTAVFDAGPGGGASVDGGVGPVQSGVAAPTPPILAPTTFLLTVTNGAGRTAVRTAFVDQLLGAGCSALPAETWVREGEAATLSATVTGNPAPGVHWERLAPGSATWALVPGAVAPALVTLPLGPADDGTRFRVIASNGGGTATCEAMVRVSWLHVLSSPADLQVTAGRDADFAASFDGNPVPSLQWELLAPGASAWAPIPGAGASAYTFGAASLADDGARLRVAASNAWGTARSAEARLGVVAAPSIASFAAAAPLLTAGEGTTLSYAFSGGAGAIDAGVGPVTSGGTSPVAPAATTTYLLTVTNALGDTATASVEVRVFPVPSIASFAAAPDHVPPGGSASLTAVFDAGPGGSASVDGGVGPVQSGVPAATPPLASATTFVLTVVNGAGRSVTRGAAVDLGIDVFPGDSIQAAIDLAVPGTTVWIHPGTYRPSANAEAMLVMRPGKNGVSLRGTGATPEETILDGNHQVLHVLFVDQGVDASTRIDNLTFTGGRAVPAEILPAGYTGVLRPEITSLADDFYNDGAGIMLFTAAPSISRLRIRDNYAFRCGGGISIFAPGGAGFPAVGPVIRDSEFRANYAGSGTGGAIDVYNGVNAEIVNDLFVGNFGWGGSIAVLEGARALIHQCTFDGGANIGAVVATPAGAATIRDSIFVNMTLQPPYDLMSGAGSQAWNNCFWNVGSWTPEAGRGHVVADPLFASGPRGAYYLSQTAAGQAAQSPCVDAGSVDASALPGLTTRTDGVPDAGAVDLGYHYLP